MSNVRPNDLDAQTAEFSKRILHALFHQLSFFPLHQPQSAPRHTLWIGPDHSGVRCCLQAARLGSHPVHCIDFETDL